MRRFVIAFVMFASAGCFDASRRIKPVDLRSSIYLAHYESHTTISTSGRLHCVTTWNKPYDPNDAAGPYQTQVRDGQLSSGQMAELARIFRDWDSFSSQFGGVADGPEIEIKYGDKLVRGGSELPEQVRKAADRIEELARSMPLLRGP